MKNLKISLLIDLYGELLTDKQLEAVTQYYNEDLSLAEIAQMQGISRQGVRDAIKRGEALLFSMESKLRLAKKLSDIRSGLEKISVDIDTIEKLNSRVVVSSGIASSVNSVRSTLKTLYDLY